MMETRKPYAFGYESMGTHWKISIWDALDTKTAADIEQSIRGASEAFDAAYSRFRSSSLVCALAQRTGLQEVPRDLVSMLRVYEKLHDLSGGMCNPLVGFALCDLGYDAEYSLRPKEHVRPVPRLHDALRVIDDTHIELHESVLIDLGALGKGFFVDRIGSMLSEAGMQRYLVDGSGDISYQGNGIPLRMGLEHPGDHAKVIGVRKLTNGAMCSSAGNRRAWGRHHHTIDPFTLSSPTEIIATWVIADHAALADGLATCLFFCPPEAFEEQYCFDYCILNKNYHVKRSKGFGGELY